MASVNAAKTNGVGESKAGKRQGCGGVAAILAVALCGGTVLSGCAGLANTSTTKLTPQEAVQISPSDITFASVPVGQKATQIATLSNTGNEAVTITQLASSAIEFATSGLAMPMLIRPGQSARFTVAYTGSTSGSASGTLMAMTSHGSSTHVKLKGNNAGTSQLSLSATIRECAGEWNGHASPDIEEFRAKRCAGRANRSNWRSIQRKWNGGAGDNIRGAVHGSAGDVCAQVSGNSDRRNYGHQQCDEPDVNRGLERKRSRSKLHHGSFAFEFEFWQRKRGKQHHAKRAGLKHGKLQRDGDAGGREWRGDFGERTGSAGNACAFTELSAARDVCSNHGRCNGGQRDGDE